MNNPAGALRALQQPARVVSSGFRQPLPERPILKPQYPREESQRHSCSDERLGAGGQSCCESGSPCKAGNPGRRCSEARSRLSELCFLRWRGVSSVFRRYKTQGRAT